VNGWGGLAGTFIVVFVSMVLLFTVPSSYFAAATILSTSCMLASAYALGLRWNRRPTWTGVLAGVASAAILYGVFFAGNFGITYYHPFGVGASNATTIYSLIASPGNPPALQFLVLLFDAAGYEAYFRGSLQARLGTRLGVASAPLVASLDAAIHIITLNPLWVATTFIADLSWGLTYHYSRSLVSSFTSHLIWDIAIFLVFPIR
jgi:membrane protease YdiL (CAAX protease family)